MTEGRKNIHGLQVSSTSTPGKTKIAKFGLAIACFVLDAVCLLSLWFSFCGRFFDAYWYFLSVETACKLFKLCHSKLGNYN